MHIIKSYYAWLDKLTSSIKNRVIRVDEAAWIIDDHEMRCSDFETKLNPSNLTALESKRRALESRNECGDTIGMFVNSESKLRVSKDPHRSGNHEGVIRLS